MAYFHVKGGEAYCTTQHMGCAGASAVVGVEMGAGSEVPALGWVLRPANQGDKTQSGAPSIPLLLRNLPGAPVPRSPTTTKGSWLFFYGDSPPR